MVSREKPWYPATSTIRPWSSASRTRPGVISRIFAFVCTGSVMIPACEPVNETASEPRSWTAIATSAHAMRSPVERSMSSSRGYGSGDTSCASARSPSVVSPIAETVATTRTPRSCASTRRFATFLIFSGSATDEPPNFMTTVSCTASVAALTAPIVAVPPVARGTGGYALPRAADGDARRARLRRDVARPRALARRAADDLGSHGARLVRPAHLRDPADHGAGVVLHDVLEDTRRSRRLRLPEPLGPHLRRWLHRHVDGDRGAASVGLRHARRWFLDRPLGAGLLPAQAGERRHGRLLPHALGREQVHVPRGAEGRDRGRRRRVPLRHEGLPHGGQGVPPPSGLRDDRPPVPARRASPRDEAVDVLRDGRDGA